MHQVDLYYMDRCLALAERAAASGEVPVAAIAVSEGRVVGVGINSREAAKDPTGHAEMDALRQAAHNLDRWRLTGVTLYVTLEPCPMCAGALVLGRVDRVVYATRDPKAGAIDSMYGIGRDAALNHQFEVAEGPRQRRAAEQLSRFFRSRRRRKGGVETSAAQSGVASDGRTE
jgi:tRNA(adenine34) deaminase